MRLKLTAVPRVTRRVIVNPDGWERVELDTTYFFKYSMDTHATHKTRFSDASTFDEICELCGATDTSGSTLLSKPCPEKVVVDASFFHTGTHVELRWTHCHQRGTAWKHEHVSTLRGEAADVGRAYTEGAAPVGVLLDACEEDTARCEPCVPSEVFTFLRAQVPPPCSKCGGAVAVYQQDKRAEAVCQECCEHPDFKYESYERDHACVGCGALRYRELDLDPDPD